MADATTRASVAADLRADLAELEAARNDLLDAVPVSAEARVRVALAVVLYERAIMRLRRRLIEAETA